MTVENRSVTYGLYDPLYGERVYFEDATLEWLESALNDIERFNIKDETKLKICIEALLREIHQRKEENMNPFINESAIANNTQPTNAETVPFGGAPPIPDGALAPTNNETFSVDLSNVSDGYSIPEGTYKVRCIDVEQRISKSGNPTFVWTFVVDGDAYAGFELRHFTAITPAAMWKVGEALQALGIGKPGEKINFTRNDVIGKTCTASIVDDEYNGKTRSRIDKLTA